MGCVSGDGHFVDHINGNTLDLRRKNLRICNRFENSRNKKLQRNNVSGLKGVCFRKDKAESEKPYQARIWTGKTNKNLGFFPTAELAHAAYMIEAKKLFGKFCRGAR
jgi:hypothetical protein